MRKSIAIVGTHPRTRELAPWNDPDTDIWVLNEAGNSIWVRGRIDGLVQIHSQPVYRSEANKTDKDHWKWLQQEHPFPIYMQEFDPLVPSSVRFPLDEIKADLLANFVDGNTGEPFTPFTNSVSFCIALAEYQGYRIAKFYGIEMESNTEYNYQRENVAFWIGHAVGHGLRVEMYCAQEYYSGLLYGYEGAISLEPEEYVKDFDKLQESARLRGERVAELTKQDEIEMQVGGDDYLASHQALLNAIGDQGLADGLVSEAERYHSKAVQKITESGTAIISRTEFEANAAASKANAEATKSKLNFDSGRCHYIWGRWSESHDPTWLDEFRKYVSVQQRNAYEVGRLAGIEQYNKIYMQFMDEKIQAAGGKRALDALTEE